MATVGVKGLMTTSVTCELQTHKLRNKDPDRHRLIKRERERDLPHEAVVVAKLDLCYAD